MYAFLISIRNSRLPPNQRLLMYKVFYILIARNSPRFDTVDWADYCIAVLLVSKKIYTTCITVVLLTALWWFTAGPLGTGSFFGRYSKRVFVANVSLTYILSCGAYLLWPGVWHRKRIYRIIGSIMGFAVALATLELTAFVGLVDYRKIIRQPFYKPWDNPDILLDEDVIFRHYPNDHFSGLTQGL